MNKRILIADDEKNMIWALKRALSKEGYDIITAENGRKAVEVFIEKEPSLVLLDLKMPEMDGIEALRRIKEYNSKIPVIILTAHGTTQTAVEAMKIGALDYISKPFDIDELKIVIKKALDYKNLNDEVNYLKEKIKENTGTIIYKSSKMEAVLDIVHKVAPTDATVLILGESGTGKELIANAIHEYSKRKNGPFIKINCAALPESLLESELFGYEKGAFTGATSRKLGKFDRAQGGTIFLDEIGEISPAMQVKLLRVLQEKEFERVGGAQTIKIDTRIIAATNRDLRKMVEENKFREDLYYRLNVIPLYIPPLRDRKEDIPVLIDYFIEKYSRQMGKRKMRISKKVLDKFIQYDWKGNIRELQNVIERCVILSSGEEIEENILPDEIKRRENFADTYFSLPDEGISLEEVERSLILQALEKTNFNQTKAAKLLGITRHTLLYRMEKYNLK
ncbi:transcriptional regulator [Caloranaerobacter sp. TR13]|uniref:sigma-54-dependent transcriptional regulator n=1 Tax=Caloranaerobacter sp. TR13 TaxID=1302151 RepID=UPI0006D9EFEE|nr:sigma-54 dependent transcriptional regulator [Caloranaerobacter sp. TR13]KPU27294.1 transcriptional regulator [Caloranaerobacter sp. TR13]